MASYLYYSITFVNRLPLPLALLIIVWKVVLVVELAVIRVAVCMLLHSLNKLYNFSPPCVIPHWLSYMRCFHSSPPRRCCVLCCGSLAHTPSVTMKSLPHCNSFRKICSLFHWQRLGQAMRWRVPQITWIVRTVRMVLLQQRQVHPKGKHYHHPLLTQTVPHQRQWPIIPVLVNRQVLRLFTQVTMQGLLRYRSPMYRSPQPYERMAPMWPRTTHYLLPHWILILLLLIITLVPPH